MRKFRRERAAAALTPVTTKGENMLTAEQERAAATKAQMLQAHDTCEDCLRRAITGVRDWDHEGQADQHYSLRQLVLARSYLQTFHDLLLTRHNDMREGGGG